MRVRGLRVAAGVALAVMACVLWCASAWAVRTRVLLAPPSPFGSFLNTAGVAVDNSGSSSTGDVYVADLGDGQLVKFNPEGQELERWGRSIGCAGAAEFAVPAYVAVSPKTGDVYVSDLERGTVTAFSPGGECLFQINSEALPAEAKPNGGMFPLGVAVSPVTGDFLVADRTNGLIDSFNGATGKWESDFPATNEGGFDSIAVNSSGDVYVLDDSHSVREYSPTGEPLGVGPLDIDNPQSVAVDPTNNHVLVGENAQSPSFQIAEYAEAGGLPLLTFAKEVFPGGGGSFGIAVSASTDDVYVSGFLASTTKAFGAVINVPEVSTGVPNVGVEGSATLAGTVNPGGVAVSSCRFEYASEAEYAPAHTYGKSEACEQSPGAGEAPVPVSATISVTPGTIYHYRLTAANENGSATPGADRSFLAPGRPQIEETSVTEVAGDSATLHAQINPERTDTTYHFEYGTSMSYGTSIPVPDTDIGPGGARVFVSLHVSGLSAGTVYHYRVVATNAVNATQGSDHTFTTQAAGLVFALPDGRQYEMVSLPNKYGTEVRGIDSFSGGGPVQASEDGSRITYLTGQPPILDAPSNGAGTQIVSTRGADGWSSQDIATPHTGPTGLPVGGGTEYLVFSPDLSLGLVQPLGKTPLTPDAPTETYNLLYLRNLVEGSYQSLLPVHVPTSQLAEFENASPDVRHVVFNTDAALTPDAVEGTIQNGSNLYEYDQASRRLGLVNVLPNGEVTPGGAVLALINGKNRRFSVSGDGSLVVWVYTPNHSLYVRNMVTGQTVQADAGSPESGEGEFEVADSTASRVFFNDPRHLTSNSTAGGSSKGDLYDFEFNTGGLTDLTVDTNGDPGGAEMQGVIGTSEDGSYVYFVANGVLAPGASLGDCTHQSPEGSGRTCNLYLLHYNGSSWTTRFIATLANDDIADFLGYAPEKLTARVLPDGRYLTFMSVRSLTGYDNRDAVSGRPDAEVYLYDAEPSDSGNLVCVSCNPTGARPAGMYDFQTHELGVSAQEMDVQTAWENHWVAGYIPAWTQIGGGTGARYQSRFLSDEGRVFFDSTDALVPNDVNGRIDVYEYEPDGVGSCRSASGCISLISSGTGSQPSLFLDASASGDDVFFITKDQLVSQDFDHSYDAYDAHVCSSAVPCFPVATASPPPCDSGDSCKPGPTPQPSIFGAPASATFSGVGNQAQPASQSPVKATSKSKKTKGRAKKQHGRKRRKRGKRSIIKKSSSGKARR